MSTFSISRRHRKSSRGREKPDTAHAEIDFAGFVDLEPKLSDGGPFQDPSFTTPVPLGESMFSRALFYTIMGNFRMV